MEFQRHQLEVVKQKNVSLLFSNANQPAGEKFSFQGCSKKTNMGFVGKYRTLFTNSVPIVTLQSYQRTNKNNIISPFKFYAH